MRNTVLVILYIIVIVRVTFAKMWKGGGANSNVEVRCLALLPTPIAPNCIFSIATFGTEFFFAPSRRQKIARTLILAAAEHPRETFPQKNTKRDKIIERDRNGNGPNARTQKLCQFRRWPFGRLSLLAFNLLWEVRSRSPWPWHCCPNYLPT